MESGIENNTVITQRSKVKIEFRYGPEISCLNLCLKDLKIRILNLVNQWSSCECSNIYCVTPIGQDTEMMLLSLPYEWISQIGQKPHRKVAFSLTRKRDYVTQDELLGHYAQ